MLLVITPENVGNCAGEVKSKSRVRMCDANLPVCRIRGCRENESRTVYGKRSIAFERSLKFWSTSSNYLAFRVGTVKLVQFTVLHTVKATTAKDLEPV